MSGAGIAWIVFGGLVCVGLIYMVGRELPAMRREMHLMQM